MTTSSLSTPILERFALGQQPWPTPDPFLFCVYHRDLYPAGNANLGPQASLAGRQLGQDFTLKDGWRMYHGQQVPGFPGHPHCGFETLTVVTEGWVDHGDSLQAAGRYGAGDVQWMTAGGGIQHSEMFPLVNPDQPNPLELFQIWLNLPRRSKQAEPCYKMLWREAIPKITLQDSQEPKSAGQLMLIAGALPAAVSKEQPLAPPPDSWASDPQNDVAVWLIDLEPNAQWTLPAAQASSHRCLYFFAGDTLKLGDETLAPAEGVALDASQAVPLHNGAQTGRLLLLQGKPIQEPVVQYGPFVGNTKADIVKAHEQYMKDQFGGWPWPNHEPVHGQEGRFARYPDGKEERP